MSPTERDLRAALQDGEGDGLDVERIIAGGRALRAQRRSRVLSAAAVTVVVAGLAIGGAFGLGTGSSKQDSRSTAGGDRSGGAQSNFAERSAAAPSAKPTTQDAAGSMTSSGPACPDAPPRSLQGGSASGADLFGKPVSSVVVCAYTRVLSSATAAPAQQPARTEFGGTQATAIVDSLEKTARTRPAVMCPDYRAADQKTLVIFGVTASGEQAGAVTTTTGAPACAVVVTNGRTIRYGWTPPDILQQALSHLPGLPRSHGPVVQGSPASS